MSAVGNANIVVVTGTGLEVTGTANVSGNITAGNITTGGGSGGNISGANVISANTFTAANTVNFASTSNVTLGAVGNLHISGGTNAYVLSTDGSGNLSWVAQSAGGGSNIANGNSNVSIASANGNITMSAVGNANVVVVTGTGANIEGTLTTTGNITAGNNIIAGSGTGGNISGANVVSANTLTASGNISAGNANLGNAATANYFIGNLYGTANSATTAGTVTTAAQPNITSVGTLTTLNVTGNANVGNIGAVAGVFTGNVSANNLTTTTKITAGNGLQVTTGTLSVLAGNLDVTGNLNVTGNVNYSNVTDLVVGDPLIYVGANNTGDTYDLGIVASYNDGTYYHTGIARDASNNTWTFFDGVVAEPTTVIDWANATYPSVKLGNLTATGTANITGNITAGNITLTGANVSLGAVGNLHITGGTNAYVLSTDGAGNLSWVAQSGGGGGGSNISNGNSNVSIATANGNITFSAVGNANVMTVTGTGANINGYANVTGNVALSGANVSLGAVGNLHITGGSNTYVLSTDGAGNLSWTAASGTSIGVDNFTGDGVETDFTLTTTPANVNATLVSVAGTFQPRTVYSLAGNVITFSSAPPDTAPIEVTTFTAGSGGGGGGGITAQDLLSPFLLMGA